MRDDDQPESPAEGLSPFEGLYREDGALDPDVAGRRLPTLVELLRHEESCFDLRIDFDRLAKALIGPGGIALRDAGDDEAFESALRQFSRDHLHKLVATGQPELAGRALQTLADDTKLSRKKRKAAAVGVALTSDLPDELGLRGRGLFDLILRISLEELHAQQKLRQRASEEGGLEPAELATFWGTYPALRHHYEKRYRLDVQAVLDALESDVLPHVVSLDIAIRGVHRMLASVAAQSEGAGSEPAGSEAAGTSDADATRALLRETFEDDMLDGGRELIVARWATSAKTARGKDGDAARADACERAVRIAGPGSPGGEMVLFHAYMRAVIEGSFHVRDEAESAAARGIFGDAGLSVDGVLRFVDHLKARGDEEAAQRVLTAGIELWPDHDSVRAWAVADARAAEERARAERMGPLYAETGETFAEDIGSDETL